MHRTCYLILAVTITCLFQAGVAWADTNGSDRPNILWIVAEDLSPWMGCYGDATNKDHTPVIDQLAAKGVLFKRTYMPAPVCSSCRSALITGVMQTTTGTQHHRSSRFTDGEIVPQELRIELPKEVVTIPERLRKAGYFTFNSGKDDYNFHYNRQELYSVGSANDYQPGMNGWQGNRSRVNGSITEDTWNARPDKKQPWFGQIQIKGGKGSDRLVDKSDKLPAESLTPPPYFPDTKVYRTAWAKHYNSVRGTDINVGKIIDQLRADGELDNTIVFFFSDHGNNESPRHKQFCYEGGVHVPLIIHGNHASIANGAVREDLVSGLDISATTLRLAGVELPEVIDGRDLFASDFSPRDHVISARDRCDYTIDRIRTVRTDRFRYIRNGFPDRSLMQAQYRDNKPIMTEMKRLKDAGKLSKYQLKHWFGQRPTEELYDIESDPHQMNSLADDPAFSETLTQHRKMLDDWIAKTGDQGQKPESQAQLKATYDLWKDRKVFSDADVNPEYDAFKNTDVNKSETSPIEFVDTFVSKELKGREFVAPRGEWTFESGIASATSTVELLKKNTIHGPNIKWHVDFTEGSIEFEMKPEDCQRVTFTLNGGGHIFRWVSTARQPGSVYDEQNCEKYRHTLIAWATKSSKQNEGEFIDAKPIKHLSELQNRWTKVSLNIDGDSGTFQVGDDVHRLSHAALKRLKTNIVLSFGYGKLSIRNFRYSVQK